MEEKWEYNFRGLGVLSLSMLLFAVGIWRFGGGAAPVSSAVGERERPICSVDTQSMQAALTFDLTHGNDYTEEILDILKDHQVKATFFVTGEWAGKYPQEVKRILADGHDLGNHSQSGGKMSGLAKEECRREVMEAHRNVKELTGYEMSLFRFPMGAYDSLAMQTVKACGYVPIQWSIDSLDWKGYGRDAVLKTVLEHPDLERGAVILFSGSAKDTVQALEDLLAGIKEKGVGLIPVSQLILEKNLP